MAKIVLENITHSYNKDVPAVEDVNAVFEDQTTNALLGPSGCGKTTILKIICGLLKPTKGKVYFDDQDVTDLPPEKRNVAIVFQFPVVYSMSVYDNLMFPLLNLKIPKEEKKKKVLEVAEMVGVSHVLNAHAPRLGPAERQRVAIGRVLIREPKVFLFDEPLSSIEPEKKAVLKTEIKKIQKKLKQTTIYVTHDQTEALTFAEKVAIMDKGRLLQFDTVENIYMKPAAAFIGFFIGSPGMNIIDGKVKDGSIDFGDFVFKLPKTMKLPSGLSDVKLGIRPEHVEVSTVEKSGWYKFIVDAYEPAGKGFGIIHISTDHHDIKVRSEQMVEELTPIWVNFPTQFVHIFDQNGMRVNV